MSSTLYRHGVVHSAADPFAEALLVDDGTVVWIGADDTADGLVSRADEVIDLDGALVAPGFVDAHVHVLETGLALESVDLSPAGGVHSLADALDAVHRAARDRTDARRPLLGFGWDELRWPEGRPPTREELDAAAGGAPVYLARVDVHSAVVSSALSARARASTAAGLELRRPGRAGRPPRRARRRPRGEPGASDRPCTGARSSTRPPAASSPCTSTPRRPSTPAQGLVELLELTADASRAACRTSWPTAASSASRSTTRARSSPRSRA